jgi:CHAD domain-containing protein
MGMLTKKRQRQYITEKERHWLQELVVFNESRDEKALHRLRLEIKKIRALVELAKVRSGKRAGAHFSGLKKMFREAGVIRDAASQVRYLEERNLLTNAHKDQQAKSIQLAADDFAAHIRRYRKKGKKASRRLKTDIKPIQTRRIQRWFAREIIRTGILLGSTRDELHEARKRIKTLLYIYKLLPVAIAQRVLLNTGYLDELQESIGQWHDAVVAVVDWTEDNPAGKLMVQRECLDKEEAVRALAGDFHQKIHRDSWTP